MNRRWKLRTCVHLALLLAIHVSVRAEPLPRGVSFHRGAVNEVIVAREGHKLAVYGARGARADGVEQVLLTHSRRDVVWAARPLIRSGAAVVAPAREAYYFEQPAAFWQQFTERRFHDYDQQSTKILAAPLKVDRSVEDQDTFTWRGLTFRALDTPGYTRGSATYLVDIDGRKLAFTGDLIYGDGQLLDLYSFQDAIPAAQIRGYHGYGSRLAALVSSLRKVADARPDVLVPARGPLVLNPQVSITRLIDRVQALYRNYLSTNALHWYFKEKRMRICAERVLGDGADIELMPYAHHEQTPDWVYENSTSRLLLADNGHGFLLDCGSQRVIDAVRDLMKKGLVKQVDGIFVTHYHDDHTQFVQAASEVFDCPVYATSQYADVLANPDAYHLPAMTENAIKDVQAVSHGTVRQWHDLELTFYFFPGQTYYHGALLAKKRDRKPILFVGDAFAPSGIDDYCVLNRNLVHEDAGYLRCLSMLREVAADAWIVNEHIPYVFSFSPAELDYLEDRYRRRIDMLRELFPWDDPNYGIDEQWAVFYPYGQQLRPSQAGSAEVRIINHSPVARTFQVTPRGHGGLQLESPRPLSITLAPRAAGAVEVPIKGAPQPGTYLVTADIRSEEMEFRQWVEALVRVDE